MKYYIENCQTKRNFTPRELFLNFFNFQHLQNKLSHKNRPYAIIRADFVV